MKINKGMNFDVVIEEARFPNMGIVYLQGKEVRIKGGIKGQKVRIVISRKRSNYMQAKILEVLEKSALETEEACPHFGRCGGCTYQELTYENELKYKEEQVRKLFKDAELDVEIEKIIGSPDIKGYRNKMEYTFGDEYKDGPLSLGMHRKGKFYEIETVEHCNIADRDFSKILMAALSFFKEEGLPFYNRRHHKGVLRNFLVRKSMTTGDILVNLVSSSQEEINTHGLVDAMLELELEGNIIGILNTINDNVADVVKADEIVQLWGEDTLTEEICGLKFKISPFSFFQTNTYAAEKLYKMVQERIGDIKGQSVFDLYSGTGTIAQIMAQVADEVVAIELVEEAVEMAGKNAKLNGIDNIEFIQGDMFKVIDEIDKKPDLIVIDPPRPGLENTIDKIIGFNPGKFIYVSCNPTTLVRDLKDFKKAGYEIGKVQLMDQFPRTPHVEVVTLLTRSEASCKEVRLMSGMSKEASFS